ncbi:Arabinan endo-1,5-alpha-L-arabinosidase [Minicystis rosea]|nr:Arabinan endo-1,5-alpha-L-arabinosidase [Minicystis rosea]
MRLAWTIGFVHRVAVAAGFASALLLGCHGDASSSGSSSSSTSSSTGTGGGRVTSGTTGGSMAGGAGGSAIDGGLDSGSSGGGAPACVTTVSTQHLSIPAHDPSLFHAPGGAWYLFATGGSLGVRRSTNLSSWSSVGNVFPSTPAWISAKLGQSITSLWAPDISYFEGRYHLYYAGSTFGSNHSVIGLATNTTLDPSAPTYAWVDEGLVLESNAPGQSDDWNAIDPNLAFDAAGNPWLVFGSFWSGIKLRRIDPLTGKLSAADPTLYALAERDGSTAIEAPSIVLHNGYYYLFVSFDSCCQGTNSTYRTMVGRATAITGPYVDRLGSDMLAGGAEGLLSSSGRYIGPGGGTAFIDGDCAYYVHHYYDGDQSGAPRLAMRPIYWTSDDWPVLGEALWQ